MDPPQLLLGHVQPSGIGSATAPRGTPLGQHAADLGLSPYEAQRLEAVATAWIEVNLPGGFKDHPFRLVNLDGG